MGHVKKFRFDEISNLISRIICFLSKINTTNNILLLLILLQSLQIDILGLRRKKL